MIFFLLSLSALQALLFLAVVIFAKGDNAAKVVSSFLALFEIVKFMYFLNLAFG